MTSNVDLSQLAVDREPASAGGGRGRRRLISRYVLPALLLTGVLLLIAWAARDVVFPPQPVTVVPVLSTKSAVQQAGAPLFQAAGWIEPRPTPVRVAALAAGVVERLLVVEDQVVKAGEPVAELVKDDAQLTYEQALAGCKLQKAALEEARAALRAAQTRLDQPVHLEAVLGQADASLAKIDTQLKNLPFETRRAEAQLEFAEKDLAGKVIAEGVVAGRDIDQARSDLDSAQALVAELRDREASLKKEQSALVAQRDALQTQLKLLADEYQAKDAALAQVQAAEARVESADVMAAEAKLRLDRMTVRAPVDGRVFRLIGHPGARIGDGGGMTQMVGHDGSTIVTLYRPEMLQVRVDVRFEDIPHVSQPQRVRINNPALESPLTGHVLFVSSEADIQKNTLEVKVAINDAPSVFKPEMLVDVTFLAPETGRKPATNERFRIYLPRQLIGQDEGGSFVWLADQSAGIVRRQPVETGAAGAGGLVEITRGLTVSSRIVAGGSEGLRDGARITVTGEEPLRPFSGGAEGGNQ